MNLKIANIFWGIVLVLVSGILLADTLGYVELNVLEASTWMFIFGAACLLFLATYFLNGVQNWGWLFPSMIFGALALTIGLAEFNVDGSIVGAPIQAAVAIPFFVAFALKPRERWWALIPAWVLTVLTFTTAFADTVHGEWIGTLFLLSAALPFLIVYLLNRSRRWALIPAYVLGVISTFPVLSLILDGNLMGTYVLYTIALPFLFIYLVNRSKNRWSLIPAAVLGVIGLIPLLSSLFSSEAVGAAVMFLFSAPFFFVYFRWKDQWWALIPAGVFASIGVIVILAVFWRSDSTGVDPLMNGLLLAEFGLTFGLLWLRRKTQPTEWAKYPAIALFVTALIAFVAGEEFLKFWPVAPLLIGVWLVLASFLKKKPEQIQPENK